MRKLSKPTILSSAVYADCIGIVRNVALKAKLAACGSLIKEAELEFDAKITKGTVHTIARETIVNGNVNALEFKKTYDNRMVGNAAGRIYYDQLIICPLNLCPLCAQRDVTTLDHYLPKALYPRLSVVPINLIPSCGDCNKGKLAEYPRTPEEETLHPYYDDVEHVLWLKAKVNQTSPVSIVFFVSRPYGWTDLLFERVRGHIKSFGLKSLYAIQAARDLAGRKQLYVKTFDGGTGAEGLRKLLSDEAESRMHNHLNSWQSALYTALAEDDWFCEEGFRQIGG